jgi:ABC-2 type transport system ATP-binding protein
VALDRVTLSVQPGEILGLVGPNGAGKTTLLRLLVGLARATHGVVRVLGHEVGWAAHQAQVGYCAEQPGFYPWLTGRQNAGVLLAGHPASRDGGRYFADALRLGPDLDRLVSSYSQGMRQRLGLGMALDTNPSLLLLDEPTNGLDPSGIAEVRDLMAQARQRGATVLVSSHALSDLERTCDRVAILHRGRLLAVGSAAELTRRIPRTRVTVRPEDVDQARRVLAAHDPRPDGESSISVIGVGRDLNRLLVENGVFADELSPVTPGLEDAFRELIAGADP